MEEKTYIENTLEKWEILDSGITNRVTTALLELAVTTWWVCSPGREEIQAVLAQKLAETFTTSWVFESIETALDKNPSLIKIKRSGDSEKEQRSGQRAKMAENFSAELYCEHFRVISDFCAMLLNFAKADIRPILKDNMKMRAINYLISELLHEVESDSRRKFYHLICEQMALTMPIYKILKLVVRQHTPEMENRKNGGLARWKSKQSPKNILVPVMRCRSD